MSGLVGAPLSGLILGRLNGVPGQPGWHWLFLIGGLPCLPLGWLVLRRFHDRVQDADWLTAGEGATWPRRSRSRARIAKGGSLWGAIRHAGLPGAGPRLLPDPGRLVRPELLGAAPDPQLGHRQPDDDRPARPPCPTSSARSAWWSSGRVSDASGERRKYVAGLLVAAALGFFAAGLFDKQTGLLVVALAVMGGGVVASIPAFWALPPRLLTGAGAAGGIALINTLGQLGGIVSPVMVGRIKDATGSTTPALYAIGVASPCALIVMKALPAAR